MPLFDDQIFDAQIFDTEGLLEPTVVSAAPMGMCLLGVGA
jgi:hypothetical protein